MSGHTLALHSLADNQQRLLRGHRNGGACTAVSADRRWLVSADSGPDSTIIVWDVRAGVPVRTYFTQQGGCGAIDLSPDAMYVVTVSASAPQIVSVWDWTAADREDPLCSAVLGTTASLMVGCVGSSMVRSGCG